jgi:hypothetical protein
MYFTGMVQSVASDFMTWFRNLLHQSRIMLGYIGYYKEGGTNV